METTQLPTDRNLNDSAGALIFVNNLFDFFSEFCAYCRYHSLHHTEMDTNFCLFMPVFDAMGNTLNAKSWQKHKEISLAAGIPYTSFHLRKLHHKFPWLKFEPISFIHSFIQAPQRATESLMIKVA